MTISTIFASNQYQSVLKNTLHSKWRVLDFCWYPKKSFSLVFYFFCFVSFCFVSFQRVYV